jgi:FlaA1/EpsC-like NDP-sugar epimerase
MTIPEAVQLVLQAAVLGKGGEVFVLDMGEPIKIVDLASDLIRLSGLRVGDDIEIHFTGLRPGEKLFEELISTDEMSRTLELERLLVVLSPNAGAYGGATAENLSGAKPVTREWHSGKDQLMSRADIVTYLQTHKVLEPFLQSGGLLP